MKAILKLVSILLALSLTATAQQWIEVDSGLPNGKGIGQISIGMNDADALWALAINQDGTNYDAFTRSIDGGNTWIAGTFDQGIGLSQLFAVDAFTCWAVFGIGSEQGLYKTTDGGVSWVRYDGAFGIGSYAKVVHFFTDTTGVAIGDPVDGYFEVYTTEDGGETWNRIPEEDLPVPFLGEFAIQGNYSSFNNNLWWGTNKGRVFYSVDLGLKWAVSQTAFGESEKVRPLFKDERNGIAFLDYLNTGIASQINYTQDGGETWIALGVEDDMFGRWFTFVPGTYATYLGSSSQTGFQGISYSLDNAVNWDILTDNFPVQAPVFINPHFGYAGTWVTDSSGGMLIYNGEPIGGGIEISDDFENYSAGDKLVEHAILNGIDFWTCWSGDTGAGGDEDPTITDEKAYSDTLSVKCDGQNNFLLKFGEIIQGKYALGIKLYIPSGFTGYYSILQSKDTITNEIVKGLEIFFNPNNGIATINYESSTSSSEFNFEYDTWFEMQHFIDLNYDIAVINYNMDEIYSWQWSTGATDEGGQNKLFAANFYANPTNGTSQYFIDDVVFALLEPPIGFASINTMPDQFNFELNYPAIAEDEISISNGGDHDLEFSIAIIYELSSDVKTTSSLFPTTLKEATNPILSIINIEDNKSLFHSLACPENSLISQPATTSDEAYNISSTENLSIFQSFENSGSITHLRFWAIDAFFDGLNWIGCDGGNIRTVEIGFYADNVGYPGTEIAKTQIEVNRLQTGEFFEESIEIFEYNISISNPALLTNGWFSIQEINDNSDCWTLILNQPGGIGKCLQYDDESFAMLSQPAGFCAVGNYYEPWLSTNLVEGTVTPSDTLAITLTCRTSNLLHKKGTDYFNAHVLIYSNDKSNPVVEIPVSLVFNFGSEIDASPTDFSFDIVFPERHTDDLTISNNGVNDLNFNIAIVYEMDLTEKSEQRFDYRKIETRKKPGSSIDFSNFSHKSTSIIECTQDALISQPANNSTSAYNSSSSAGNKIYQSFNNGGVISGITFWAIDYYLDGTSWSPCDAGDSRVFEIGFYADNGGEPGLQLATEELEVTRVETDEFFPGSLPIYQYDLYFPNPMLIANGWFSIEEVGIATECWTMILNKPGGLGQCLILENDSYILEDVPIGFCMIGGYYETWLRINTISGTVSPGSFSTLLLECITESLPNPDTSNIYQASVIIHSNDLERPVVFASANLKLNFGLILDPPTNLNAEIDDLSVLLTWTSPGIPPETFFEGFENGALPEEWLSIDNNDDGFTWLNIMEQGFGFSAYEGEGCMTSPSYDNTAGPLEPDNYLITPPIEIGINSELSFYHASQDSDWPDDFYYVKLSTTGNDINDFTVTLFEGEAPKIWEQVVIDLSQYSGQTVYLAFHHTNCTDRFWLKIDNVMVSSTPSFSKFTKPKNSIKEIGAPHKILNFDSESEFESLADYPAKSVVEYKVLNFNVYRNSIKIADGITRTQYIDDNIAAGSYLYYITAVYEEGESDPSNVINVIVSSIDEQSKEIFHVYPNPAQSEIQVSFGTNNSIKNGLLSIFQMDGKLIKSIPFDESNSVIDISDLRKGVFVLSINVNDDLYYQKLIKQ